MRKLVLASLLLLVALHASGHAGEVHSYMGTVTALSESGFTLKTTDGKGVAVTVSPQTVYRHADGRAAKRADLGEGRRVVVTIATDGKTATMIKLGPASR